MKLTILTFGIAREICGGRKIQIEAPDQATASDVKQLLTEQFPGLGGLSAFLLAVNEDFAEPDTLIVAGDEIAIIPPVSGG